MEVKIFPTILAADEAEFCRLTDLAESLADYMQFDFTDSSLAPSQSVSIETMGRHRPRCDFELDLLVARPEDYLERARIIGAKRVIIYIEPLGSRAQSVIDHAHTLGLSVALGNQIATPAASFEKFVPGIQEVQFFTGKLGYYGGKFDPKVLPKIAALHTKFPDKDLGIDGGVSLENAASIKAAGVNCFAIGSHLMQAKDPAAEYAKFQKILTNKVK